MEARFNWPAHGTRHSRLFPFKIICSYCYSSEKLKELQEFVNVSLSKAVQKGIDMMIKFYKPFLFIRYLQLYFSLLNNIALYI